MTKKEEDKIYGHIKTVHIEIPKEIVDLPQSDKWLYAMCGAPVWKKDEYAAQSLAWEEYEGFNEHPNWCNPLARS